MDQFEGAIPFDVDAPGGRIRYYRAGTRGPAVVLLHGGVLDSSELAYGKVVPTLAESYRVYALDWPEHGHSWPWRGRTDEATLARTLAWAIAHWELDRFDLVGMSQGGGMALRFALDQPDRVGRVIAIGPVGLEDRAWVLALMAIPIRIPVLARLATRLLARSRWLIGMMMRIARTRGKATVGFQEAVSIGHDQARVAVENGETILDDYLVECYRWPGRRIDYRRELSGLAVPTLIVHGQKDPATSARALRRAAASMPLGRFTQVPSVGHLACRDDPVALTDVIDSFLSERLAPPAAASGGGPDR